MPIQVSVRNDTSSWIRADSSTGEKKLRYMAKTALERTSKIFFFEAQIGFSDTWRTNAVIGFVEYQDKLVGYRIEGEKIFTVHAKDHNYVWNKALWPAPKYQELPPFRR